MTRDEINSLVRRVCDSDYQCPVYSAMHRLAGDYTFVMCDCHGTRKLSNCQLREALELAADEERKAKRSMIAKGKRVRRRRSGKAFEWALDEGV